MVRDIRDEDPPWYRQLVVVLGLLLLVALVIGGVIGVVAIGAAKVSGIDATARASSTAPASLVVPTGEPTVGLEEYPAPSAEGQSRTARSPSASPTGKKSARARPITLQVSPRRVPSGGHINLSGLYTGGGAGVRLQIQRFENGAWGDFPVTVPVNGGGFGTYITTSRAGVQRLRVLDVATGRSSNDVRVTVG